MFKQLTLGGIVVAAFAGGPALAGNCATRQAVIDHLQTKYAEQLTMGGMQTATGSGTVMEVWSSPDTGTFTVLVTQPSGISCIIAVGTDFFQAERRPNTVKDIPS